MTQPNIAYIASAIESSINENERNVAHHKPDCQKAARVRASIPVMRQCVADLRRPGISHTEALCVLENALRDCKPEGLGE